MRALLIAATLLAACAAQTPSSPAGLAGTSWVADHAVTGGRIPTIAFEAARASGDAPCNQWFGAVTISGSSLQFGGIGMTRRACEQPAMNGERDFSAMLASVRSYSIEAGALVLQGANGQELARFRRAP